MEWLLVLQINHKNNYLVFLIKRVPLFIPFYLKILISSGFNLLSIDQTVFEKVFSIFNDFVPNDSICDTDFTICLLKQLRELLWKFLVGDIIMFLINHILAISYPEKFHRSGIEINHDSKVS